MSATGSYATTAGANNTGTRVRLSATDGGSARTRTVSAPGSEYGGDGMPTPQGTLGGTLGHTALSGLSSRTVQMPASEDLRAFVARLEAMQAQQRSPQQPSPDIDSELARVLAGRPEWRAKMAVYTKSAALRKKILTVLPPGGRAVGSAVVGATHVWRQRVPDTYSDHNWPKAITSHDTGMHHLPGGTSVDHQRLLRSSVDRVALDPLISHTPFYSIPRTKRFPGTLHNGELDCAGVQKRSNPGPGAYFKSLPRGPSFSVDGGETIICGPNHIAPWKKPMGHHINPVCVDVTAMHSQPCWSFSKSRKTVSDTAVGHLCQDGGPVKSDLGCLGPGPVYEHHSSMRPFAPTVGGRPIGYRKKVKKTASMPLIRMEAAPPDKKSEQEAAAEA